MTEATLLPLVHTSAQKRNNAFHERGGWLNQCDVLCDIIPTRQLKPAVMQELPEIVRTCRAAVKAVVRGRARALALLRRDTRARHRCKIARSEDRLRSCVRCALCFVLARMRAWARARVCVLVYVFLCRTVQYRDKQSRQ